MGPWDVTNFRSFFYNGPFTLSAGSMAGVDTGFNRDPRARLIPCPQGKNSYSNSLPGAHGAYPALPRSYVTNGRFYVRIS